MQILEWHVAHADEHVQVAWALSVFPLLNILGPKFKIKNSRMDPPFCFFFVPLLSLHFP